MFYGLDQTIIITVPTTDGAGSGVNASKIYIKDSNLTTNVNKSLFSAWAVMTSLGSHRYTINVGHDWNQICDFNCIVGFQVKVTDNVDLNSVDTNTSVVGVLYSMTNPPGTAVSGSINFQDVNNFADIDTLIFNDINGRGRIAFYDQNIDLGTAEKAAKLRALSTSLKMSLDVLGNSYVDLNTIAFNDVNKRAKVTIYNLPFATMPGILIGDTNCSSIGDCIDRNYDYNAIEGKGRFDFNVGHFTRYTVDGIVPTITVGSTSTGAGYITIPITLNEPGSCRYIEGITATYATGAAYTQSDYNVGKLTVDVNMVGLGGGSYDYTFACIDLIGNESTKTVSFSVSGGRGGSSSTGGRPGAKRTTVTTTIGNVTISESSDSFTPTASEVTDALSALKDDDGLPLYTPAEVAVMAASSKDYAFTKTLKVEEVTSSTGAKSYKSTFTISVKNNNSTDMGSVLVVETIPKAVASTITASQIESALQFSVLAADPVVQFTVPLIKAGQSYSLEYVLNTTAKPGMASLSAPAIGGEQVVVPSVTPPATTPPSTTPPVTTPPVVSTQIAQAGMDYIMPIVVIIVIMVMIVVAVVTMGKGKKGKHSK